MKITKRQLRRIIREEKSKIMDECPMDDMDMQPSVDVVEVGPEPAATDSSLMAETTSADGELVVEMELASRALEQVVESVQNAAHLCPDCTGPVAAQAQIMEAMVAQAEALQEMLEAQAGLVAESVELDFTGDVGELPGDEAFAVGYTAGSQGL